MKQSPRLSRRDLLSLPRRSAPADDDEGYWLHLSRTAMACTFEVTLPAELDRYLDVAKAALDEVDALEAQLTIFRDSSELSAINRQAAFSPVAVEPRLFELLGTCERLCRETDGAFDITSTPLSRVWGFLRRQGRIPSPEEIAAARAAVGMGHVRLDPAARTVAFDHPEVSLNLGSIGKGYALDRVAESMQAAGVPTALLTAGQSSIRALGGGPTGEGYVVGVRDPSDHTRRFGTVRLRDCALGVSGAGEQSFEVDGRRYGHVLDPRTGWPVESRALSAVVAPTAALADALTTAVFVGGGELAERHTRACSDVSVVVLDMPLPGQHPHPVIFGGGVDWRFARAP